MDVLYRVSTRGQESEGESLFNQSREVEEKWAAPHGIRVRRRIEVAESGKSALRLVGNAFVFNRRAQYTDLIVEYQSMPESARPDAIVIDWVDRWSRNVLEYSGLIAAFRMLGIRLLAIGDGLDLTDPRNDLVAHIRAAVGQEQVRIIKEKVCESRRSRRERGKWQGGSCPDGYRTHDPSCPGLKAVTKETPDGKRRTVKVRACDCPQTVLRRDPAREATIICIWQLLETSALSWQAMADELQTKGLCRPDGKAYGWHDLYRLGENPHYAGVMTSDRWVRDQHDSSKIKRRRPLREQNLKKDTDCILDPYVSEEVFWNIYERRYNKHTRNLSRSKHGSVSELTGILYCPKCDRPMSSFYGQSSKKTGHGNPRLSPIKKYIYMWCSKAQGATPTCSNRQRVRVERFSRALVDRLAATTRMSDAAILAALKLRQSQGSLRDLETEHKRLTRDIELADAARHTLTKLLVAQTMTQAEFEQEIFQHRRDKSVAESRLRVVEAQLSQQRAQPDFGKARYTIEWLAERWTDLTVAERAEALRILVERVTYEPNGSVNPDTIEIVSYGRAFVEPAFTGTVSQRASHG